MKDHSACTHAHTCSNDTDIRKIVKVLMIIVIFMLVELWGHFRTRSLSLLADALHLLVDISGFIVSIVTLCIAKRNETARMTWGYQRVEVLGALLSVALIWTAVGYLMVESFHKYIHPQEIDGLIFFLIAAIGLVVNLICVYVLHIGEYHHAIKEKNLNIRATYVHVIGDVVQSIGVIVASGIIYFYPTFVIADVLCTIFFAFLVLASTICIVKDALYILAEGAPAGIDQDAIRQFILKEDAVIKICELRLWSISINKHAIMLKILTDHLLIREYEELLTKISTYLKSEMQIEVVTIQIDTPQTNKDSAGFTVGGVALNSVVIENIK